MFKVFNMYANHGSISLEKGIDCKNGVVKTSLASPFGVIQPSSVFCKKIVYSNHDVDSYIKSCQTSNNSDGHKELTIWNCTDNITEEFKTQNEEAIILFTSYVDISEEQQAERLIYNLAGRESHTGMWALKPNAKFKANIPFQSSELFQLISVVHKDIQELHFVKFERHHM